MKLLEEYKKEGWRYEYEPAFGCYALFRPDGRVVWKDYYSMATEDHVVKVIESYKQNIIGII